MFRHSWYFRRNQREEPIKEIPGHFSVLDGSLIIQSVREDDAGSYICTASNSEGSETLEVTLSVSASLSVHIQPAIQTVDLGRPAYMVNNYYKGFHQLKELLQTHESFFGFIWITNKNKASLSIFTFQTLICALNNESKEVIFIT